MKIKYFLGIIFSILFACSNILANDKFPFLNSSLLPRSEEDLWKSAPPAFRDPELRRTEQALRDPDERFGAFNQRRKLGPKFFSIYPGFTVQLMTLSVGNAFGSGTMAHENADIQGSIDLKLPDFQIGKYWGFSFLVKTSYFNLDRQIIREPGSSGSGSSSGSRNSSGSSGLSSSRYFLFNSSSNDNAASESTSSRKDLGTRVRGRYSYSFPIIYYGEEGVDRFRVGVGFGPAEAVLEGEIAFTSGFNPLLFTGGNLPRDQYLRGLGTFALLNGTNPGIDPLRTYFLLNLSEGNNLNYYGTYLFSKGQIINPIQNPLNLLQYIILKGQTGFTDFEILTLLSLGNGSVSTRVRTSGAWMLFWEIPFGDVNIRFSGAGPVFKANNYEFQFSIFEMAVYLPIDF
ncbi:MAG: hypothetical protein JJT78_09650 [Leptospira sp.]|nr:hypothetical protein [Leptospira sp.]